MTMTNENERRPRLPLGIYVHLPFCSSRCSYCDFATYVRGERFFAPYAQALVQEIKHPAFSHLRATHSIDSIFFGGGTPSLVPAILLSTLEALKAAMPLSSDAEITLEANPENLTEEDAQKLFEAGFNRVSLGLQTTDPTLLARMGRRHRLEEVERDLTFLRRLGFSNLSLDLILGLPGQRKDHIQKDLDFLAKWQPDHVSWYGLILEEKTKLFRQVKEGKLQLPGEEEALALQDLAFSGLKKLGYQRYEVSNFAKAGKESRHNLKYWTGEEYLGLGLAAASYLGRERYTNPRSMASYLGPIQAGKLARVQEERTRADDLFEQVMMGLRKTAGVDRAAFFQKNGLDPFQLGPQTFQQAADQGLLTIGESLAFSERGMDLQNAILSDLLLEMERRPLALAEALKSEEAMDLGEKPSQRHAGSEFPSGI